MNNPATVDFSGLDKAIREISEKSGVAIEDVTENEAEGILQETMDDTSSAKVSSINARFNNQKFGTYTTRNGSKKYFLGNAYPNDIWKEIQSQRKASLQKKVRARGLSKQSWKRLANIVGLHVQAPGYVDAAMPPSGPHPENFRAQKMKDRGKFYIHFSNAQPTVNKIGGGLTLAFAIQGRIKYFEKNLELGVFRSIDEIKAAYPGLIV